MKAVIAYTDRLLRLANSATLRSELTMFSLARDAEEPVLEEHRPGKLLSSCICPWMPMVRHWHTNMRSNLTQEFFSPKAMRPGGTS